MTDPGIHNWLRLDSRVTTSGQPTEAELSSLRDVGVRHVINLALHTHERALLDEAGSVHALGMAYAHIPVAFDHPTEADFARFCAALEATGNDAVHVHCIMNWRVSAFFYRYRRDVLCMDEAAARADMTRLWEPDAVWAEFIRRPATG
ncbi:MAG TPA: protein tyrosine phosphatase family protein [Acetobacteraceae bacterium]